MVDSDKRANTSSPSATNSQTAGSQGSQREEFKQEGEEFKQQARSTSEEVKDAARQQAEGLLDRQKDAAAEQAEKFSTVLHKMADEFDNQQQPYFSGCVNDLARRSDVLSQGLRERDLSDLLNQARDYGRRQPALFVGGAIAAGFLMSRFLRSSGEHRNDTPGSHRY